MPDDFPPELRDEPVLESVRPTRVTTFLECLFDPELVGHMKALPVWKQIENGWINFSHLTEDMADNSAFPSLSRDGCLLPACAAVLSSAEVARPASISSFQ